MPKLDKTRVLALLQTHRRYRGNMRTLAEATGIPYGTLRNAVGCGDDMRYERISYVADALDVLDPSLIIEATGIPSPPPEQPKGPKGPPPARKKKDGEKENNRPKRDGDALRAAS